MKIGAVILVGGKSRRMKTDKAALSYEGMSFLERVSKELEGFDEVILSTGDDRRYENVSLPVVKDIYSDCGPMGGLHAALSACKSDALLAVPCDLPLFRRELGEYLCKQMSSDIDAVVPVTSDGHIHTLCAVYGRQTAQIFEKYLKSGRFCLLDPYEEMRVKYIAVDQTPLRESWLENVNTPEEYRALCGGEAKKHEPAGQFGKGERAMSISLEEATALIRSRIERLKPVRLPLYDTLGCITAEEVTAQMDQPPFPRSPYDGYALRAQDIKNASRETPVTLKVTGRSFAGKPAQLVLGQNEAVRIMTGGVILEGADCVIPQEKTDEGEEQVKIFASLEPNENYCGQGEDFVRGTGIVHENIPVTAAVVGVAASAGCTELLVYPKPKAAVLSTGDELQTLGTPLKMGQIYNSNSPLLSGRLSELRISVTQSTHIRDELQELMEAIEEASESSDLVICTGGVSVGQKDLVPAALIGLGAEIVFHGVAIKPGMPAVFALLHGKPILALSGNPFACAVTFELLARPALAELSSNPHFEARRLKTVLAKDFTHRHPTRRFQRGILSEVGVVIPEDQGNGQLRTMIGCNCLVELPAGDKPLWAGTTVNTYLLEGEIYGL